MSEPAAGHGGPGAAEPAARDGRLDGTEQVDRPPRSAATIEQGDRLILLDPATGRRWLVQAEPGAYKEKGLGVFDPGRFVGGVLGDRVTVAGKELVLLEPDLPDLMATIKRKAAVILPKDAARIVHELGIGIGDRVLESGIGSGASTIALAWTVGDAGRIVVQELRQDFIGWAMANVERAGLGGRVETHLGDLTEGLAPGIEGPFTAALLDQPQPWDALVHILPVLAPGARVAAYCPQVSQMEQTARAMEGAGFGDVRSLEVIERHWEIKERGSRPRHEGLMHTAFLVVGRNLRPAR